MQSTNQMPIMTNSESVLQFHNNAYAKPATALNILRETILGRELFDYAFRQYAVRWQFKRPMPADFFRTMEDASGVDLDWFFRGWFYTTAHTDISIEQVRQYVVDSRDPNVEKSNDKKEKNGQPKSLSEQRNEELPKRVDEFPELKDFYNSFDRLNVTPKDRKEYEQLLKGLSDDEKKLLKSKQHFYVVDFKNLGGLVMPIILNIEYEGGKEEEIRIPAEIWRRNNQEVSKLLITQKKIVSLTLDPHQETADVDLENNHFPRRPVKSRFQLFKMQKNGKNDMQLNGVKKL